MMYYLFAGKDNSTGLGWNSYIGSFVLFESARKKLEHLLETQYYWAHIVDTDTLCIIYDENDHDVLNNHFQEITVKPAETILEAYERVIELTKRHVKEYRIILKSQDKYFSAPEIDEIILRNTTESVNLDVRCKPIKSEKTIQCDEIIVCDRNGKMVIGNTVNLLLGNGDIIQQTFRML